jgi:hypothetical protein
VFYYLNDPVVFIVMEGELVKNSEDICCHPDFICDLGILLKFD